MSRACPTILIVLMFWMPGLSCQSRQPQTAWEELLQEDLSAVDNPEIGWQERLILHALPPEQARAYYQGTDPDSLVLDSGQNLTEYLKSRISPPGSLYVPLLAPCRLHGGESSLEIMNPGEFRSFQARGEDLSWQGGSLTGCEIPQEAVAVALSGEERKDCSRNCMLSGGNR